MKKLSLSCLAALAALGIAEAKTCELKSPDGNLSVKIEDGEKLNYSLYLDGEPLLENCEISMDTTGGKLGANARIIKQTSRKIDQKQKAPMFIKSEIRDFCNESTFDFGNYKLIVRLYDDAFAYRFATDFGENKPLIVKSETFDLKFPSDATSWVQPSHGERAYFEDEIRTVPVEKLGDVFASGLPYIVQLKNAKVAVLESDVFNYPALRVAYNKEKKHPQGWQSRYPKTFKTEGGGRIIVGDEFEDFIAKTVGTRSFPWRILQVARQDKDLLASDIVYKLATPSKIKDLSWISHGICTWDWMSRNNLAGVDFDPGMNQQTVHYFIDFAAKFGITFSLVDEGWVRGNINKDDDLVLKQSFNIDVDKASAYAREKNVKFLLWALARNMAYKTDETFKLIAEKGVVGLKIDFIERDDQLANELYENFAKTAAKYKLVVFYHGCARPTGLNRTYPNILSYESVRGNEFPQNMIPQQNIKIAQTRNLVGPLDYTPGVMTNSQTRPSRLRDLLVTWGTRSSQMALFVMYDSRIQMICDSPTTYEKEPEVTKFLAQIPTVWDDTKGIASKFDEYASLARRKGDTWYFAGLTLKGDHNHKQDLSQFLDPKLRYRAEIFRDTKNSHKIGMDFKHEVIEVGGGDTITFPIADNGGFIMKFTPIK